MKIIYITIIVALTIAGYLVYYYNTQEKCGWKITNCCPEDAGASWECVKIKDFKEPDCTDLILCPQVISPKPSAKCVNVNGVCSVE